MGLLLKAALSGIIIALASELARRFPLWGAVMVSIPCISLLTAIWLNYETKDVAQVGVFLKNVFWAHIPTLAFFIVCPFLLKVTQNFWLSLFLSLIITAGIFFAYAELMKHFGIRIYEP